MIIRASNKPEAKITYKTQQRITNKLLKILKEKNPEVIVAGGAPRNWFLKKLAKDVDVYLKHPFDPPFLGFEKMKSPFEEEGLNISKLKLTNKIYDNGAIKDIHEIIYEKIDFQIMAICPNILKWSFENNIEKFILSNFDFNICKCFYDGNKIKLSKEAKEDFENKTLTFSLSQSLTKPSYNLAKRSEKMSSYFPDYKIKVGP